mgnify:CR=1 FL=1
MCAVLYTQCWRVLWCVEYRNLICIFCFPGDCLLLSGAVAPSCVCNHGFDGISCDMCTPNFVGSQCESCRDDYIGYNTTCDTFCANGYATVYGKSFA